MSQSTLHRHLKTHLIFGANTSLGKTIISTLLLRNTPYSHYLKPVSTGPSREADDGHISKFAASAKVKCLYQYKEALSPHLAATGDVPNDLTILRGVQEYVQRIKEDSGRGSLFLETAGGVHSPTPSGTSQADAYRPLRWPICLVADSRLGGISASISAFESLHLRGYDLDVVCMFEDGQYQNHVYLRDYFEKKGVNLVAIPRPPERNQVVEKDEEKLGEWYEKVGGSDVVKEMAESLMERHKTRLSNIDSMAGRAYNKIWYPFTQHTSVSPRNILTIDSASGDCFQGHKASERNKELEVLEPMFDGSASWWTQGLGHGNPELSLAAAYSAGRYGHVMFAGTIHEPALKLAENLLKHLQNLRLQKCFFSDNGSTGMEVATKMALSAAYEKYKWDKPKNEIGVIGLKGSYHGDTIGAMDCSEPSTFNEKVHWYKGRGYWFDFPQVKMINGQWTVRAPEVPELADVSSEYNSLGEVFDIQARLSSPIARKYRRYVRETLHKLVKEDKMTFGALIMEPVILGAGGMLSADPLFQHCLVEVVREGSSLFGPAMTSPASDPDAWSGLPVVFDEVFTGLYRLGRFSAASLLQIDPDVSVHAKLLTGGLVPLCTTLASNSIYSAFLGSEKRDALLHGHSYTAHPIGCHVANTSLTRMREMDQDGSWQTFKNGWGGESKTNKSSVWSMWSEDFVRSVSKQESVESVFALGSVLAISLCDDANAGYSSSVAAGLQQWLSSGENGPKVHSRVLGNVFYLMASQKTSQVMIQSLEATLMKGLASGSKS
ncbi:onanonoxo-7-onima-8-eninoihtemlysoneda [Amylocarpus encephaloides]|uniref:Onanonoxo-7-onima-8-eninoihtemlysoneda n=1 Tax=Amylocarpus encephaloides TaxID=45428 RepID=A0A9P7YI56_9HELO|nr:onanonoxo-7-onima-8-eninoihtemlysoneda [Amylocarpus encephaloides]